MVASLLLSSQMKTVSCYFALFINESSRQNLVEHYLLVSSRREVVIGLCSTRILYSCSVRLTTPTSTVALLQQRLQRTPEAPLKLSRVYYNLTLCVFHTSSTSILVQQGDVPAADQNGIILSYTITCKALPGGTPKPEVVIALTTEVTLIDLNEFTNYSITVFASTVKGAGNDNEPIIVITDEDSKLKYCACTGGGHKK